MAVGGITVKSRSSTQGYIATLSGQSYFDALLREAAEALGWRLKPNLHVDSSAAKAVSGRVGLGKTTHIEVRYWWVQQAFRRWMTDVNATRRDRNPADILSKAKNVHNTNLLLEPVMVTSEV